MTHPIYDSPFELGQNVTVWMFNNPYFHSWTGFTVSGYVSHITYFTTGVYEYEVRTVIPGVGCISGLRMEDMWPADDPVRSLEVKGRLVLES